MSAQAALQLEHRVTESLATHEPSFVLAEVKRQMDQFGHVTVYSMDIDGFQKLAGCSIYTGRNAVGEYKRVVGHVEKSHLLSYLVLNRDGELVLHHDCGREAVVINRAEQARLGAANYGWLQEVESMESLSDTVVFQN